MIGMKSDIISYAEDLAENYRENDFEESVFFKYPLLGEIKAELYHQGAAYASMSGSGSTIFGLFRSRPSGEQAFSDHFTFVCQL